MSKKPKGRKRLQLAAEAAAASTSTTDASTAAAAEPESAISKAKRRKLQKKRAKLQARVEHEAAAEERAAQKAAREAEKAARAAAAPPSLPHPVPPPLVFAAAEDDHCETAPEAYAHIAPILALLAARLGKTPATLRVYDPYFCNGAVVRHLNALGYEHVHNVNEDFYAVLATGSVPEHDVVVTNPPYSGTHPQRLLDFLHRNAKPWLALMPNWVCEKDYHDDANVTSYYLYPLKRYQYWTPRGRRSDVAAGGAKAKTHGHTNAALGARTSPFISFWYGGGLPGGVTTEELLRASAVPEACRLCSRRADLPSSVRDR